MLYSFQSTKVTYLKVNGGDEEDRTPDPLRARQVLSQLSYTPMSFFQHEYFIILVESCQEIFYKNSQN